MTLREHQAKHEHMQALLVLKAHDLDTPVVCLEWFRTIEQQKMKVAQGLSKTMNSQHLEGLAKDYAFLEDILDDGKINFKPEKYLELGLYWESIGGEWGGRYGDDPATPNKIEGWDSMHFGYRRDKHENKFTIQT